MIPHLAVARSRGYSTLPSWTTANNWLTTSLRLACRRCFSWVRRSISSRLRCFLVLVISSSAIVASFSLMAACTASCLKHIIIADKAIQFKARTNFGRCYWLLALYTAVENWIGAEDALFVISTEIFPMSQNVKYKEKDFFFLPEWKQVQKVEKPRIYSL